jgi:hypothetical protein
MSTTIKLKKVVPAAVVSAPAAPVNQSAPPIVIVTPPPAAVATAPPAVIVMQPPAKTQAEIDYAEFLAFKAMKAAVDSSPAPILTPSVVPAAQTVEQQADAILARPDPITQAPPAVAAPAADIRTPEDAEEDRTVTAPGHYKAIAGVEGNWNAKRHAIVPRVQIVQGNGQLSARFPVSTLLLQDDVFLPAATMVQVRPSVRFVPLNLRLQYRERLEKDAQNSGLKPRIAFSPEDVLAMGGQYEWKNNVRPNFEETARVVMLIEQPPLPEGAVEHPGFSELPGLKGKFCPAVYYASGVAFAYFAKVIYSASVSTLKIQGPDGIPIPYMPKRWWKFTVDTRRWGSFSPWCLIANQTPVDTSNEERDWIAGFLGQEILDEE